MGKLQNIQLAFSHYNKFAFLLQKLFDWQQ